MLQTDLHLSQSAILQMMKVEVQEQGCTTSAMQCQVLLLFACFAVQRLYILNVLFCL